MTKLEKLKINSFVSGIAVGFGIVAFALAVTVKWIFIFPFVLAMISARIFANDADVIQKEIENGIKDN